MTTIVQNLRYWCVSMQENQLGDMELKQNEDQVIQRNEADIKLVIYPTVWQLDNFLFYTFKRFSIWQFCTQAG